MSFGVTAKVLNPLEMERLYPGECLERAQTAILEAQLGILAQIDKAIADATTEGNVNYQTLVDTHQIESVEGLSKTELDVSDSLVRNMRSYVEGTARMFSYFGQDKRAATAFNEIERQFAPFVMENFIRSFVLKAVGSLVKKLEGVYPSFSNNPAIYEPSEKVKRGYESYLEFN